MLFDDWWKITIHVSYKNTLLYKQLLWKWIKVEQLDFIICNDVCQAQQYLTEYEKLKKELQGIYEVNGKGETSKSQATWTEKEEKPKKVFFEP